MKDLFSNFKSRLADLGDDERGAESSEVFLVLVVLVIGLAAAFGGLRMILSGKAEQIGACINEADSSTSAGCEGGSVTGGDE